MRAAVVDDKKIPPSFAAFSTVWDLGECDKRILGYGWIKGHWESWIFIFAIYLCPRRSRDGELGPFRAQPGGGVRPLDS